MKRNYTFSEGYQVGEVQVAVSRGAGCWLSGDQSLMENRSVRTSAERWSSGFELTRTRETRLCFQTKTVQL